MYQISLMEAYLIEFLREKNVSDETIIDKVLSEEVDGFEEMYPDFDFSILTSYAKENPNAFKIVVQEGYQVKFLTINGLKKLLELKFSKYPHEDYQVIDSGLQDLILTDFELEKLRQLVSSNWQFTVIAHQDTNQVKITVG